MKKQKHYKVKEAIKNKDKKYNIKITKKRQLYFIEYFDEVKFMSSDNDYSIEIKKTPKGISIIKKFIKLCKSHNCELRDLLTGEVLRCTKEEI